MIELPQELIIEGVARAFTQFLEAHPDLGEKLLDRMAELHCELLTPCEAADMIELTRETLREKYRDYGFTKSLVLGPNEPRYFRSQIVEAMKREGKVINGRTPREEAVRETLAKRITPFPRRQAPTVPSKAVLSA
jgi:hypothetical protein